MRALDPSRISAAERLAEIAELLALGVQRLLASECKSSAAPKNSQVRLAEVGPVEAPCASRVQSPQSTEPAA